MTKATLSYFLCVVFLLSSCSKDIDVDISEFESQLVLNSIFSPNKSWEVSLTNSRNIFDENSEIQIIEDAQVYVKNLKTLEKLPLEFVDDGFYKHPSKPESDGDFRITVEHPDFRDLVAYNNIPTDLDIDATTIDTTTTIINGNAALEINFHIKDREDEDNFYVWDLMYENSNNASILPSKNAFLQSADLNTDNVNSSQNGRQSMLFITDQNFNGTDYNTTFYSINRAISDDLGGPIENPIYNGGNNGRKISLRILSVSEELFNYLKSVEEFYQTQNPGSSAINPVDIESNIEGGLGIFGAYKEMIIDIQ